MTVTISRRGLFGVLAASAAGTVAAKLGVSDPDVPRQVDADQGGMWVPVLVYRNGRELKRVTKYDLDAQTVTVLRLTPNGHPYVATDNTVARETLHGGVVVRWDRKRLADEAEHERKRKADSRALARERQRLVEATARGAIDPLHLEAFDANRDSFVHNTSARVKRVPSRSAIGQRVEGAIADAERRIKRFIETLSA